MSGNLHPTPDQELMSAKVLLQTWAQGHVEVINRKIISQAFNVCTQNSQAYYALEKLAQRRAWELSQSNDKKPPSEDRKLRHDATLPQCSNHEDRRNPFDRSRRVRHTGGIE